ncbi:MAG: guanylate cyclase [Deltaproteobacteria bacterium]|nr:guanylate cyclase [Deltaproteobacteria bacterium]
MYKERFENIFRLAKKLTSSLDIGDVLEIIRDEAKNSIPQLREACLLVVDPQAEHYTRPLHCAVEKKRINCQLCKRGRLTVAGALDKGASTMCYLPGGSTAVVVPQGLSEIVVPIYLEGKPLAVLDAISKPESTLGKKDLIVLQDLAELASNVIKNAKGHWKIAQAKMTVDSMLKHLRPFVPATVQRIVERNPGAPEFEKRDIEVTVLFLDIAGYTRISETQTRGKVNFIIEKYFSAFLDILYSRGGDINETAGDGLMVIFQGDVETSSIGAARGALEIRKKTDEINEELKSRFPKVEINMGINSGVASVGMTKFEGSTGTRMTFTATGPVTNLAARIAAAAQNGDILIGPETAKHVKERIQLFERGLMEFKNVSEPIEIFSLVRSEELEMKGQC